MLCSQMKRHLFLFIKYMYVLFIFKRVEMTLSERVRPRQRTQTAILTLSS